MVTATTGETLVGSLQTKPVSSARLMVTPTRVLMAHGSVLEVKVTSGLVTTPQVTETGAVVVLVVEDVELPLGGTEDVEHAARMMAIATRNARPSHCTAMRPPGGLSCI